MADTATAPKPVKLARTGTPGVWMKIVLVPREVGGHWPHKVFVTRYDGGYAVTSRHESFNKAGLPTLEAAREFIARTATKVRGLV